MSVDLQSLLPMIQQSMLGLWLVFLRVGALVSVLPTFGEQSIPVRVRLGIALAFTAIVTPAIPEISDLQRPQGFEILAVTLPEAITGLFFGLLLRFFVFTLQVAGSIAAQSTSLSQIFGGSAGVDPQPAMGHVLVVSGLALAAMMGLHVQFAAYIIHTYEMVPFGVLLDSADVMQLGLERISATFALGFSLSAPFVIASLLYNVTLGVINRAMPQLMVSFVGAPAITAGGLLILAIAAPLMLVVWLEALQQFVMMPVGV